jgi:hypothetical protein
MNPIFWPLAYRTPIDGFGTINRESDNGLWNANFSLSLLHDNRAARLVQNAAFYALKAWISRTDNSKITR